MTEIARIKAALEFLKDNHGFKVGGLFLSIRDNVVFVAGSTNYDDLKNVNKRIATRELNEIKVEFNEYIELVPEFKNFLKGKSIEYFLTYNVGMSDILICSESNEKMKWEQELME
jgi:hypothetical protein